MKKLPIKNITPLFILTIIGMLFCVAEITILLLSRDKGELATGLLTILGLLLLVLLLIDRFLIKKVVIKKVIITEVVLIISALFFYLHFNKKTQIRIETTKQYFVLLYDKNGLSKKQIPVSGLFDHSITINGDSIVNLNYTLLYEKEVEVIEPKNWGGHFKMNFDTLLKGNPFKIEMYFNTVSSEMRDSLFNKTVSDLVGAPFSTKKK